MRGGGVWVLAWSPLNISIPAIKYSMRWELESLLSLNYRSVFNCAFPLTELIKIHAKRNSLDQKDCGNFPLHFTTQDTYLQSAEYGLKHFQGEKRFRYVSHFLNKYTVFWRFFLNERIDVFISPSFEKKRSGCLIQKCSGTCSFSARGLASPSNGQEINKLPFQSFLSGRIRQVFAEYDGFCCLCW